MLVLVPSGPFRSAHWPRLIVVWFAIRVAGRVAGRGVGRGVVNPAGFVVYTADWDNVG
jgi:hypothetical protein